jgi:protein SCO1/2
MAHYEERILKNQSNMNRKTSFWVAISVAVIIPIIFLVVFASLDNPSLDPNKILPIYGNKKPIERTNSKGKVVVDTIYHTIPSFSFVSHLGDTITQSRLKGKVTVVDFFFSTCPTICVDMASNMRLVQETFAKEEKRDLQILSFTVDPETDSVAQLFKYAQDNEINSNLWLLLTGSKKELYDLARYGFMITATQGDGGPDDFIHDNKFVVIDKEGRIRGYYDGTNKVEVEKMIQDIQNLLASYLVPLKNED